MSMDARVADLLARLEQKPDDATALHALLQLYVSADLMNSDRVAIRARTSTVPAIYAAYNRVSEALTVDDPVMKLRLRLAILSITDGMPSTRDLSQIVEQWIYEARQAGVDPRPHMHTIRAISGTEIAGLLGVRLSLRETSSLSTEDRIDALLEYLMKNPRHAKGLEALADIYIDPRTTPEQRLQIRAVTTTKPAVYEGLNRWEPDCKDTDPEHYYRLRLAAISMADALPNWRKTITTVLELKAFARRKRVGIQPIAQEIANLSTDRTAMVIMREHR
jgi:hypothetical protein